MRVRIAEVEARENRGGAALQKNHKKIFHKPLDKRWERCIIKSKVRQGQTCERARIISAGKPKEVEGFGNKRKKRGYCREGAKDKEKKRLQKRTSNKSKCPQKRTGQKQVSTKADRKQKQVSIKADRK